MYRVGVYFVQDREIANVQLCLVERRTTRADAVHTYFLKDYFPFAPLNMPFPPSARPLGVGFIYPFVDSPAATTSNLGMPQCPWIEGKDR